MASCFLVFWETWVYELIIFKTLSMRILWVLGWTRILLAFVSPSCIMGTDNRGPFKLNSSFGILWIIFYFPPTIKVKMGTFSHILFFFSHFYYEHFYYTLFVLFTNLPMHPLPYLSTTPKCFWCVWKYIPLCHTCILLIESIFVYWRITFKLHDMHRFKIFCSMAFSFMKI